VLLNIIRHHRPKLSAIVPDCIPTLQFEQLTALLSFRNESQNIKTRPERKRRGKDCESKAKKKQKVCKSIRMQDCQIVDEE